MAQLLSIYHWAKASDKYGRRPIIFAGVVGIALSSIWLGFSKTLTTVVLSRALGKDYYYLLDNWNEL